jgi:hypothetical protein
MRTEFRRDEIVWVRVGVPESEHDRARRLAEHDAAFPPEDIGYLWRWFEDLSDWRDSAFGVGPLSHQEIESWGRLMRIDPPIGPFEAEVLRKLDRECRSFHAEKNDPARPASATPIADSLSYVAAAHAAEKAERQAAKTKKGGNK